MRKLIAILAVLALAGAVSAQKKKKPAAKPAATIDTAKANAEAKAKGTQDAAKAKADAAQADLAAKAAAATAVDESKFAIAAWGGYNIGPKTDLYNAVDTYADAAATTGNNFSSKSTDAKSNGIAGGVDFWYGDKFQLGLGTSYRQGFKSTKTLNFGSTTKVTNTTELNYIPVLLQARIFIVEGLYAGAGVGVAVVNGGKTEAAITGATLAGLPLSVKYEGSAIWAEARLGYRLGLGEKVGIDIFGIFAYQSSTVSWTDLDATGNAVATGDIKNNGLNITPALAVSYKF